MTIYKNTPEQARALLVDSLRSGDYDQTSRRLRIGDKFCCLGVACDLFLKHEGMGEWKSRTDSVLSGVYEFVLELDESAAALPRDVREWLGFRYSDGSIGDLYSLSGKNDIGETFDKIADRIEKGEVQLNDD